MSIIKKSNLILEVVPPIMKHGEKGIEECLIKLETIHKATGIDLVNIPELHDESSKNPRGERKREFEERLEPRVLGFRIQEQLKLGCIINRVVVLLTPEKQCDWFRETHDKYGINNFVLVGGEKSTINYPGPSVITANQLIRKTITDPILQVGNISIPSRKNEAKRMKKKIDSGAGFFTTQIIYHAEEFIRLLDELSNHNSLTKENKIFLSLSPIRTERSIKFLRWLGVTISNELEEKLIEDPDLIEKKSLEHIEDIWTQICKYVNIIQSSFRVGINLCPIGVIPSSTNIELSKTLFRINGRKYNGMVSSPSLRNH
jgi:5,10-methylenetetrahydrofolate reductase